MIELVFEYKQYLRNIRGLVEGTCNSYPTYLIAITNHLKIEITSQTITDDEKVSSILDKLKKTGIDKKYWGNCQSALRAYLEFLQYNKNVVTVLPDEEVKFVEGVCVQVQVNRFERNSNARSKCIDHHKAVCKVCSLNFAEKYGDIGKGFIHVHHIIPLSEINTAYEVNPIKDLIPVCPNCHAMLHTKKPPYTVNELKKMIKT